jgi:hypothetical protein
MKTQQEYSEEIDVLNKQISYEDDPQKKQHLINRLQKKKLEKEINLIRDRIRQLG